ncbi:ABC-F family ATP-binding cassette domain-containing protein [Dinoroseobacter sp. S375]|uniref:ABC-F family ATP-binding cassette domain-containing protein n=1 Tax=Dinoroseobacter sp. S375 TaxID=3415136 RepID=UPI003C7C5D07
MSTISIAGLGWHTPNSEPLYSDLTLTFGPVRTGLVGRNGTGKTTLLRLIAGELTPDQGSIAAPPAIGFLRQTPERMEGANFADLFGMADQLASLRRAEAGEATAEDLATADWTLEARLQSALGRLGLDQPLETRLDRLSGGQRTRASLAALLFAKPDALLLDEPTNHLDRAGRQSVIAALRDWRGCAVIASHDRTLLGEMDAIVELTRLGARIHGGPYADYAAAKAAELAAAAQDLTRAEQALKETHAQAQQAADRKARTDRQGRQLRASGSQSKLVLDAAKERSEGSSRAAARLHTRQTEAAEAAVQAARAAVELHEPLLMAVPSCALARGREVVSVDSLRFRYHPDRPLLEGVSLAIHGPERVAIHGANGAGKSTLLACIDGQLDPQGGTVTLHVPAARIDQDLSLLRPAETVREAFARLDPETSENARRAVLARFLFRGADADQTIGALSGGQRMRAALACTLGHSQPRQLLILDEPSNHLDIDAVQTLEAALNAYDGAILVVSHDPAFLDRIGVARRVNL